MGGGSGSSSYSKLSLKVFLGAVATVVFVLLLLVRALESSSGAKSEMTTSSSKLTSIDEATQNDDDQVIKGRDKLVYNSELHLNYLTSTRRVPNGPDPIHNRRAGNSKRPPGRA